MELQRNPPPNTDPNVRIFSIRGTPQQLEKARQLIDERIGVGGLAYCAPLIFMSAHVATVWVGEGWAGGRRDDTRGYTSRIHQMDLMECISARPCPLTLSVGFLFFNTSVVSLSAAGSRAGRKRQLRLESLQPRSRHSSSAVKSNLFIIFFFSLQQQCRLINVCLTQLIFS